MGKKILINVGFKEKRIAVLEGSKLVELAIERSVDKEASFGSIYKGKVANVLPGMDAAFVNLGLDKNAFIHAGDIESNQNEKTHKIQKLVHPGEEILVQIKKEAMGQKGARVTAKLTVPGRFLVLMPKSNGIGISRRIEDEQERDRLKEVATRIKPDNMGLILRTAACGVAEELLESDLRSLIEIWEEIEKKAYQKKAPALIYSDDDQTYRTLRNLLISDIDEIVVDSQEEATKIRELLSLNTSTAKTPSVTYYSSKEPLFNAYNIESQIDRSLRRKIWLDCGGFLIFDQTEALLIVDVNTGKFTGKDSLKNTVLQTNLDAAEEIARQLRLRNVGGIVIIDFIDMDNPQDREQVYQRLAECLKKDRTRTNLLGFTSLGLLELTRQKSSHDLSSMMQKNCPECAGSGKILDEETIALRILRELKVVSLNTSGLKLVVKAHQRVLSKLAEILEAEEKTRLEKDLRLEIEFEEYGHRLWDYQILELF